jgi:hypothetical protein
VVALFVVTAAVGASARGPAQAPLPAPAPPPQNVPAPSFPPAELDRIASPVAVNPDPLLAQVLAAATFSAEIPDAAG